MMQEVLDYSYPEEMFDTHGYPLEAALNYIRNWGALRSEDGLRLVFGKKFSQSDIRELLDYVKELWTYEDAYLEEDGLLELHTLGWSGNEAIIEELKGTILWLMSWKGTMVGGHYYFKLDLDSKWDWDIDKKINKLCHYSGLPSVKSYE
jgi:hypothetical protein